MKFLKAVSRGSGDQSYTIRLPFFLSPKGVFKELRDVEKGIQVEISLGGRKAFIEKRDVHLLLTVPDFENEKEAREFLSRVGVAFIEFAAAEKMGVQFDVTPQPLDEKPYRNLVLMAGQDPPKGWKVKKDVRFIDGICVPYQTAIIPEHKKIIEDPARLVEITRVIELVELEKAFTAGARFTDPAKIFADKKIRLAIEIYANAAYHRDHRVTLINLVTVLEILSEPKAATKKISALISKMQTLALAEAAKIKTASGKLPYENLADRLKDFRRSSVSEAFRNLFYEYGETGLSRAESDAIAKNIYNIRSKLVHEGLIKAKGGVTGEHRILIVLDELEKLTPVILENRIKAIVGI